MKAVSIIVPIYNTEKYLEECLDSLINQTLKDIEIILVNDGSKDKSGDICKKYKLLDKRIKLIEQNNYGQSIARNKGLELATGEYVLFVDSDDYISHKACEVLFKTAKKYNLDIVHGDLINDLELLKKNSNFRKIKSENKVINGIDYIKESLNSNSYDIVLVLNLTKKEYLVKNNIFFQKGLFFEDQEHTMKLFSKKESRVMKIKFPYYYYRMDREESTTNEYSLKKGLDCIEIIKKMIFYIENNNFDLEKKYLKLLVYLSFYHLSSIWLKMKEKDQLIILNRLKSDNEIKDFLKKVKYPNFRIRLQVIIFNKYPKLLLKLNKVKDGVKKWK